MDEGTLTTLGVVAAFLFGGGGVVTGVKVLVDRRAGVKGEERAARRDMIGDRDGLIATLLARTAALEARADKSDRLNEWLRHLNEILSDHINVLEAFAWALGRGEAKLPPPPRPPSPPMNAEPKGPDNG